MTQKLRQNGWRVLYKGINHTIFANGETSGSIPRHAEVDEGLVKDIVNTGN